MEEEGGTERKKEKKEKPGVKELGEKRNRQ
jgi:hypothetical protein